MSCIIRVWLPIALLLVTAHRLPAPISEIPETTPTPKPKREVISKTKPKPEESLKPKASPSLSFAGTWTGSTVNTWSGDGRRENCVYVIKISNDEKMVWIKWDGAGQNIDYQAPCSRFRETLTWSLKQIGENPEWISTDTLRINANGTASFVETGRYILGPSNTFNHTGTLSRQ
jgi:hypothetical protein